MKRLLLVINPVAGKMRLKGALMDILKVFCQEGYEVTTQVTLHRGHGTELASNAKDLGYDQIVCCGGDGTLNECISGIIGAGSDITVGYIPCGSTNDFAETLNLALSPERAAFDAVTGRPYSLDIGNFNGERYFSYIASFGAFTETSYMVSQSVKNRLGHLAYILGGVKDLGDIKSYKVSAQGDGFECSGEYIFGAVSNTTSVAGIVKLSAGIVNLQDGLFEVLLVRTPKNIYQLQEIMNGIAFSDFSSDMFVFEKTSKIDFQMGVSVNWSLDGEGAAGGRSVHIECLPSAITLRK